MAGVQACPCAGAGARGRGGGGRGRLQPAGRVGWACSVQARAGWGLGATGQCRHWARARSGCPPTPQRRHQALERQQAMAARVPAVQQRQQAARAAGIQARVQGQQQLQTQGSRVRGWAGAAAQRAALCTRKCPCLAHARLRLGAGAATKRSASRPPPPTSPAHPLGLPQVQQPFAARVQAGQQRA